MSAVLSDGKALAAELRLRIKERAFAFAGARGRSPGLHVIIVGADPASRIYTANKHKAATEAGLHSVLHELPSDVPQAQLLALIAQLNVDDSVDGILVQLPLPAHIKEREVLHAVEPSKDVDGFHPVNAGALAIGRKGLVPCTPRACMHILSAWGVTPYEKTAVVIGRSNIVGRPVAQLLLRADATVIITHRHTLDLPAMTRQADILVVAVGKPDFVRGDWIKPGAAVIDVGINRIDDVAAPKGTRVVGDVCADEVSKVAGYLTPVPGGVGPLTIACLLENTLIAAEARAELPQLAALAGAL